MIADKEKVQLAMARKCFGLNDIAEASKMPLPTIKNVVNGRNVNPSTLGRIAKVLNIDVADILAEKKDS